MPPKKKSLNEKKEEAKEREETKKKTAKESKDKAEADAYWAAAGEGQNKSAQKKEEEERKRQEQAAKRAELKRLQEEEEAALTKAKSKLAPAGSQKITKYQLDKQREIEEQLKQEALKERNMALKREVDEDSYHRMVVQENINRLDEDAVHARTIEHAVAALTVGDAVPEDKHPEKRMKASWKAFEERMLIELKQDKPGLKMSQYKDMIWKLWQKSPDNPLNQVAAAAAAAGPSR